MTDSPRYNGTAETTPTSKSKKRKRGPAAYVQKVQATPAQKDSAQTTPKEPAAPESEPDIWQVSHSTFTRFFRCPSSFGMLWQSCTC